MSLNLLKVYSDETLGQAVHDTYSARARTGATASYSERIAKAFGYSPEELQSIPVESHMGLGCGNPVAAASIREGENVLDLGSGGGIDIFLAAAKVGPTGQAIGLDMSADMIKRARNNAISRELRPPQVAFVEAKLTESLPIASESINCVLSNCVINLLPLDGKSSLLKEVYRVLKPGGRIFFDDIVAKKTLPDKIRNDLAYFVGCISGSITEDCYKKLLVDAGLRDIVFADTKGDINIYNQAEVNSYPISSKCCKSKASFGSREPESDFDANLCVGSFQIYALKPESKEESTITPLPLLRWWDAYPAVRSIDVPRISNSEVADLLLNASDRHFAVIDVRRNDHGGGHVRGSHQWAAQTFYDDLPSFYANFGNTEKVIFYCGNSNGRGPRSAGWYQDYLNLQGNVKSRAYVLKGGINDWLAKFSQDAKLSDRDPTD